MSRGIAWRVPALAAGLLALATACTRSEYSFEYETEHVRVARNFDAPLCAGTLRAIDRDAARIATQLDAEELAPMDIVLGIEAVFEHCPEGSRGCAQPGERVWSELGSVGHELVHAFAGPAPGGVHAFFEEGLAEALGGGALGIHRLELESEDMAILDIVAATQLNDAQYEIAGHFVTWLIERWGLSSFLEFRASLGTTGTFAAIDETFLDAYGVTLAAAEAMWRSTAPSTYTLGDGGCAGPSEPWVDEGRWSATMRADCDDISTRGPLGGWTQVEPGMVRTVLVDVLRPGRYRLSGAASRSATLELDSATCGCWNASFQGREEYAVAEDARTYEVDLSACRYELSLVVGGVEPTEAEVDLELLEADPW